MDTSRRRLIRLMIVSATAAGVALASPVVAVADDSEVIEAAPIDEGSAPPIDVPPTTEPLVIELVVEGTPPIESPDGTQPEQPAEDAALMPLELPSDQSGEPTESVAMLVTASDPTGADPSPMIAALEPADEHSGGSGGSGGSGDPYRITFEVSWRLPDDSTIPVLDELVPGELVPTDWREIFDLAAASATGGGQPTSAHCTYAPDSTDLVCEFQNPGHGSDVDGMVVPKKKTATYTVTVLWPVAGWTIDGANAGPYSASDVCSGGGHSGGGGHEGGSDSGHGETLEAAALDEGVADCVHTVIMRVTPKSPGTEPPASEVPAAAPPATQTPVTPEAAAAPPAVEVLAVAATPRTLPATGNTATTTLMIGTIILALGGCLFALSRRRGDLPVS